VNNALMFSKASDEWSTPQGCYDALDAEFGFALDAAASKANRKCHWFFGPDHQTEDCRDALAVDWGTHLAQLGASGESIWLNPPYSKCREFIAKAAAEAKNGCTVVCLVPSRTDTRWWHEHVWDREKHQPRVGVQVRFIKGRLTFGGAPAGAPFPSVVIVFRAAVKGAE
jgi:site-specific DNA-methyltransferase (adenine-specific)